MVVDGQPFAHGLAFVGVERATLARGDQRGDARRGQLDDQVTTHQHGEDPAVDLERIGAEALTADIHAS
ncbi:MAG TPA: hypothetical protein VFG86_24435 [Chloroflexota bacterium]|nr:hypothetical protein [Chloroflexota bacterium]